MSKRIAELIDALRRLPDDIGPHLGRDAADALCRLRAQRDAAHEALVAIHTAARGDAKGECWTIRTWMDERGIFNDDISSIKRLVELVAAFALDITTAEAMKQRTRYCKNCGATAGTTDCDATGWACEMVDLGS